jgi:beta-aspartyl-dipeptidase (metallo-type)
MMQCRLALKKLDFEGISLERVTVSSQSFGSIPTFDENGDLIKYTYGKSKTFLQFLHKMYFQDMWSLEKILPLMTSNPANFLKLKGKGKLEVGSDADILLLDKNTLKLKSVIAKGRVVMTPKWTHQGMFGISNPTPLHRTSNAVEKRAKDRKRLVP